MTSAPKKGKGTTKKSTPAKSKVKGAAKKSTAKKPAAKRSAAKERAAKERSPAPSKPVEAKTAAAKEAAPAAKPAVEQTPAESKPASATQASPTAAAEASPAAAKQVWNPRIVVFACNWCSYAGADTAGVSRIQHQPHFRMIRVMCSGRIQPSFVLHAFEKGADGVLVSGCHFGDCHYVFGNERAVEQFAITKNIVKLLGIEEGRLRLEWISAAEGVRFAEVINEFTEQVRALGPSPLSKKREAA